MHASLITQVTALVERLLAEEKQSRMLKWVIISLFIFTLILLAAMTGLTYAIVAAFKDTEVNGTILVSKSGNTIQVASSDFALIDGAMVSRTSSSSGSSMDGSGRHLLQGAATAMGVGAVQTSSFAGVLLELTSAMEIDSLIELNFLHVSTADMLPWA
jgi:hypothetical protein